MHTLIIIGYKVSTPYAWRVFLQALDMALINRIYKKYPLIHHSDRSLQYCSNEYQKLLKDNDITPSMTEK
jgi:transposase InsO family protein